MIFSSQREAKDLRVCTSLFISPDRLVVLLINATDVSAAAESNRHEEKPTHDSPEIPVILTPSALWTCLIHPDALLLVGVLIS
ncbi:hypothetical protein AMELA_G00212680 [Ameiurus melas]|uniref:Uncharacterized protein n=1 Tax=Ameiurus melas TaxID=219545 RepID=A0A7J6A0I5_AMEME|nr:hypothetical protein AMELA_G00212680 [Ameiurus melas]